MSAATAERVSPAQKSARHSVWVRPIGCAWKFRVETINAAESLRAALESESVTTTNAERRHSHEYVFVGQLAGQVSQRENSDWLTGFFSRHMLFQLMHDPA